LLRISEADRLARQNQIEQLTGLLQVSESDRLARQDQIEQLTGLLSVSEADRSIALTQVELVNKFLVKNNEELLLINSQYGDMTTNINLLNNDLNNLILNYKSIYEELDVTKVETKNLKHIISQLTQATILEKLKFFFSNTK
jgi:chromosome segregation ATPase